MQLPQLELKEQKHNSWISLNFSGYRSVRWRARATISARLVVFVPSCFCFERVCQRFLGLFLNVMFLSRRHDGGAQADVVKLVHRCKVGSAGGRRFYKWRTSLETCPVLKPDFKSLSCCCGCEGLPPSGPSPSSRQPYIMNPPESRWTQSDLCKVALVHLCCFWCSSCRSSGVPAAEPHLVLVLVSLL